MENPERKKNQTQRHRKIRMIGGENGAVIAWGGAMAIAGLVAAFAIKSRVGIGRRKDSAQAKEPAKEEQTDNVEEQNSGGGRGEEDKAKPGNFNVMQKAQIDSVDLVSAILGEKPKDKDDGAAHQDMAPLINYAIPAHAEIVDPFNTLNPDVQEIIPFTKLKPEFLAGIVEECKSLVEGPVPLKEVQGPVERLILKPIINQVEAEALLSPITEEVEEHYDDYGGEEEEEHADEEEGDGESMDEVEEVSDEIDQTSSMNNDEAIWPAEMIEELSRELKGMKIELERPQEEDRGLITAEHSNAMNQEFLILKEKEEVVPVQVAQTAELSRSRTWMRLSMFVMFLLVLLLVRFDAMSCVLRET